MMLHLLSTWLVSPLILLIGFAAAIVVTTALSWLVMRGGPIDCPRERGAHDQPTPTSGGLAMIGGTALAVGLVVWLFGAQIPGGARDGLLLLAFASLMGLCGALDDVFDLPARLRLGFQVVLSLAFSSLYHVTQLDFGPGLILNLPVWVSIAGSTLWLVLGINAINFMDGANGLAVGSQTLALAVFALLILLLAPLSPIGAWLGLPLVIAVCAIGAHLGFLPFNLPPGRTRRALAFQGDAGSLFGGALITGLTLMVRAYGVGSVWIGGFVLAPLLVDVVLTLIVRARHGQNLMRPHKEHLYQLWLQKRDPSHLRLAWRIWLLIAASSGVGLAARLIDWRYHTDIRFIALACVLAFYSLGWMRLRERLLAAPVKGTTAVSQA
ncbi:glycosyl transferase family 4 family protein [Asticcacaulis sp. EMRT-3]|uniref:glycosyltransferase family 4 protein n=1 Tax=Asticcacaulis sp. EMRT-3 TaxID=3040349 RepID=UPI0024AF97D8|nr:glycosyl transferase family 4 family protein [Asticcacaulis sp. EMRT-3]MDI7775215.1 glycosyl transferase family 4 family protein [Asticcacaulis sp. EMRT-3]